MFLYFFILFVLGLGSQIWVTIFYHKKTDTIIEELKRNGEIEIAENINNQGSKQPMGGSFSQKRKLFYEAWKKFEKADLTNKSEFLVKAQRLFRFLGYISLLVLVVFLIPFVLIAILIIVSIF
jgi:hypothetical protein